MHEVIADGPLQTDQYYSVGKVTEFNGCYFVQCIRGGDLNCLYNFGTYYLLLYMDRKSKSTFWAEKQSFISLNCFKVVQYTLGDMT